MIISAYSQVIHTTVLLRKVKAQINHAIFLKSYKISILKLCKLVIQCVPKNI